MDTFISVLSSNRFKSFYWRSGAMLAMGFVSLVAGSLADFQLPSYVVVVLGLVLGEITKALNTYVQNLSEIQ